MRTLLAIACFAALLVGAAAAPAAQWHLTAAQTQTAHQIADAHWGTVACGGQVDEYWAHLGRGRNATSYWTSVVETDPSTYSECSTAYSYDVGWDWPKYCTIVMHESGHLTGHGHAAFKWNVMYLYYEAPAVECTRAQAWYRPPARTRRAHKPDAAS